MLPYKSILVIAILIMNAEGTALKPDLPFKTYSQVCVMDGKNITYRMNDLPNLGAEVLCKVDYSQMAIPFANEVDETELAKGFAGNLGQDFEVIKKDVRYTKHYSLTKSDALATYSKEGVKTEYKEIDKDEVVKFTQWDNR